MELISTILSALSQAPGAVRNAVSAGQWMIGFIRAHSRNRKAGEVLQWLHDLGSVSEADIRRLVGEWDPTEDPAPGVRDELTMLLTNLVRTSRFHTTQGTPLSSYLRCERLIEQLLANLVPKLRSGQPVGPGRSEWKLERFLGMGGFGEVWVARNPHFPLRRAFKFFTAAGSMDWLRREADALFHIKDKLDDHPNVIEYLDIATDATPYPFLMLEFVGGGSLEDWILTPMAERRPLEVSELMAGIARGLAEAHRHKIYHRDLKPANVLLTGDTDPVPKVADFGLSRVELDAPGGSSAMASQAVIVGTRMYLPPEAADPYESRTPAQDDVFAFGVLWYQVLTGRIERPPYDFADRLHRDVADSRTVRLISLCLAHPARRFKDAGELLVELETEGGPEVWAVPDGCFDVGPLAREYIDRQVR